MSKQINLEVDTASWNKFRKICLDKNISARQFLANVVYSEVKNNENRD